MIQTAAPPLTARILGSVCVKKEPQDAAVTPVCRDSTGEETEPAVWVSMGGGGATATLWDKVPQTPLTNTCPLFRKRLR